MKNKRAKSLSNGQRSKKANLFLDKLVLKFLRAFDEEGYYENEVTKQVFESCDAQWRDHARKKSLNEESYKGIIDKLLADIKKAGKKIKQPLTNGNPDEIKRSEDPSSLMPDESISVNSPTP